MKIAAQNLLLIAPIFLLLALVTSLLLFFSERGEVQWGLESEAAGLALTIAEFTDAEALSRLAGPGTGGATLAGLRAPLERILAFGQARRVALTYTGGATARPVVDVGAGAGTPLRLDGDIPGRLALDEVVTARAPGAGDRLVAHAPIRDAAGVMRGVATVETSTAPAVAHRAAVLRRTAIVTLGLFVVGCLVSLGISAVITRDIARLTRTAEAFAGGTCDARLARASIEEVAVVGSTFAIMGSVLKDAALRSTREMLQFDRVAPEAALTLSFAERFAAPLEAGHGGVRLAADRLGTATRGDFWFVSRTGERYRACLGRVDAAASFDALLGASAVAALLEEGLARGADVPAIVAEAADIIPIHCCVVLEWEGGRTRPLAIYRLQGGRAAWRTLEPMPGETVALTTLDEESDRRAARYASAHAFDTPRSCIDELRRFFGDGPHGGVLVLQVTS